MNFYILTSLRTYFTKHLRRSQMYPAETSTSFPFPTNINLVAFICASRVNLLWHIHAAKSTSYDIYIKLKVPNLSWETGYLSITYTSVLSVKMGRIAFPFISPSFFIIYPSFPRNRVLFGESYNVFCSSMCVYLCLCFCVCIHKHTPLP